MYKTYSKLEFHYIVLFLADNFSFKLFSLDNQIDGEAFCELTEEDIKQMVQPLGVVKKICRLQKSVTSIHEASTVSSSIFLAVYY